MDDSKLALPPLFSPLQIAIASALGGPMAACWLFSRNYRTLGQPRGARNCLVWGLVGMLALFVMAYYLPANFPRVAIPLGYTFGLYQTAQQLHGATVREHLAAGGSLGLWRQVIAVSLLVLAALLVLLLGVEALLGWSGSA